MDPEHIVTRSRELLLSLVGRESTLILMRETGVIRGC